MKTHPWGLWMNQPFRPLPQVSSSGRFLLFELEAAPGDVLQRILRAPKILRQGKESELVQTLARVRHGQLNLHCPDFSFRQPKARSGRRRRRSPFSRASSASASKMDWCQSSCMAPRLRCSRQAEIHHIVSQPAREYRLLIYEMVYAYSCIIFCIRRCV